MEEIFDFHCSYCGKEFGKEVIDLAVHIGKIHDPTRKKDQKKSIKEHNITRIVKCYNVKEGCYHYQAAHFEGKGKCLVEGCKCSKFHEGLP